ncbi:MAG: MMPL family transporter [Actinomycetia bacterium]|nr:MMPL family transporter [Actinomycetes bacterium]
MTASLAPESTRKPHLLARLGRWCVHRRKLVVFGIWIPLFVVLNAASGAVGSDFHTEMKLPSGEAADVFDLLKSVSDEAAGFDAEIVFYSPDGVNTDEITESLSAFFGEVEKLEGVDVTSPFDSPDPEISEDGTVGVARLKITERSQQDAIKLADEIRALGDKVSLTQADGSKLQIEYGGWVFSKFEFPASEALGIIAAVVILVLAFGSVIAMGLPIGTALVGLGMGTAIVGLLSHVQSMPDFTSQMVAMIGLGVGIDYALFIVTRYRAALHDGLSVEEAVVEAVDTSGRAVVFAGITVMISLVGLYLIGLEFVSGLATGATVGVLVMMLASITLLPALLAMTGHRINVTSRAALAALAVLVVAALGAIITTNIGILLVGLLVSAVVLVASFFVKSLRKPVPHRAEKPGEQSLWYRWSRIVQRRPWRVLAVSVGLLVFLMIPLFSIRLGFGDMGNAPEDQTVRKAYDLLADGFGPGSNGPLVITVTGSAADDNAARQEFVELLRGVEGVSAAFSPPEALRPGLAIVTVIPDSAPQDEATNELVNRLRDDIVPASGVEALVGGQTAAGMDFATYLGSRLPLLIGAVLILSFLLLMAVFRSVLVPLKAVVMNLLSIGAAYGVIVAIFQWGWAKDLIGVGKEGPIDAWVPMMLFAIVFGLSMDYEVFLLSRIKEEYDRTGDNGLAVADGLAVTARVITAAALIMVCVFSAFVLGDERSLKLFGLGLAAAVAIDATIVRMLLVPATMELLGNRNWWIPKWIDKLLPKIDVEGYHHQAPAIGAHDEKS